MRFLIIALTFGLINCQKAPIAARAANPDFKLAKAPMESTTTNALFLSNKEQLKNILNLPSLLQTTSVPLNLQKYIPKNYPVSQLEQNMIIASYCFDERRFIDAAFILSEILDKDSKHPGARTLLARCFYFLGNEDRALKELEHVLVTQHDNLHEVLDALYLSGAIPLESNSQDKDRIKKAIGAFETYLKIASQSPERESIQKAVATLKDRLKHLKKLPRPSLTLSPLGGAKEF